MNWFCTLSSTKRIACAAVAVLMAAASAKAVPTSVDVTARQRYPWNGIVDIDIDISYPDQAAGALFYVYNSKYLYGILPIDSAMLASDTTQTQPFVVMKPGSYHIVWDADADVPNFRGDTELLIMVYVSDSTGSSIIDYGQVDIALSLNTLKSSILYAGGGNPVRIPYSTRWENASTVSVAVDGTVLKSASAPADGEILWTASDVTPGRHTLTHTTDKGTQTADCFVFGDDVVMHDVMYGNETWTADKVHVVTDSIYIGEGESISIQSGAIVKFCPQTTMYVFEGGTLSAMGTVAQPIMFTSLKDDEHGGDTNQDGTDTTPDLNDWGNVIVVGTANLEHVSILYAGGQSDQGSLYIYYGGKATLRCCTIAHGQYDGIRHLGDVSAENTVIYDCARGVCSNGGKGIFRNCVIDNCQWGVMAEGKGGGYASGIYTNCIITGFYYDPSAGMSASGDDLGLGYGVSQWRGGTLSVAYCDVWSDKDGIIPFAWCKGDNCIEKDPHFIDAANGDFRILGNSPCVDAGDGAAAPERDFYGRPRMNVSVVRGTGTAAANGAAPDIGIYEFDGDGDVPAPDLKVMSVSAPPTLTVGETATILWTVQNVGEEPASTPWRDEIEIVSANGQVFTMGTENINRVIAPGGTATFSAALRVPAATEGSVQVRVTANKHGDLFESKATENNANSTAATLVAPTLALASGESVSLSIPADPDTGFALNGGSALASQGGVMIVSGADNLDAWLGDGSLSAKDNAVREAVQINDNMWVLQVPANSAPRVTVRNDGTGSATAQLSLQVGAFFLLDAGRISAANSGFITVPFAGNGFDETMECWIERNGIRVEMAGLTVESGVFAHVSFDVTNCETGDWTLFVKRGADTVSADLLTLVQPTGDAKFVGEVNIPETIRANRTYVGTFRYGNEGGVSIDAPYVRLEAKGATLIRLSEADAWAKSVEFLAASDTYPASILKAGDTSSVAFFFTATDKSAEIEYAYTLSSAEAFPWENAETDLRPSWASDQLWGFAFATLRTNFGQTWDDYLDRLRADCDHLLKIGSPTKRLDRILQLELNDALGIDAAMPTLANATDLARGGRGMGLSLSRTYASSLRGRLSSGILGYGWTDNYSSYAELLDDETLVFHLPSGGSYSFTKASGEWKPQDGRDKTELTETATEYILAYRNGTTQIVLKAGAKKKTKSIRDALGNTLSFTYSGDKLTKVAHSDGQTLSLTYSGGKLTKATDDQGRSVTYDYNGGLLSSVTAFNGLVTHYEYHAADNTPLSRALTRIIHPDGTTTEFDYDDSGLLRATSANGGQLATRIERGACGSYAVIAPNGGRTEVTVGASGETLKTVNAKGEIVRQTYSADTLLESTIAPSGRRSMLTHDRDGNPVTASSASGATTAFSYEPDFGNLASVTDAKGHAFNYSYDDFGRNDAVAYADGSEATVEYDARGDMVCSTNRRGESVTFEYDAEGNLTKKTWPNGRTFTFVYDAKGNVTTAADSETGAVTMEYDANERMTRIVYPKNRGFTFAYDAFGRMIERTALGGTGFVPSAADTQRFAYDAFGRLATVTDGDGNPYLTNAYDPVTGWLATQTYGNGTVVSNAYDVLGRTVGIYHLKNGSRLAFFEYEYDEDGRCVSQTTAEGVESYTYDADGQLTGVTYPDGTSETFAYDAVGNRITANGASYTVNNLNQYTAISGGPTAVSAITYDRDGNLTSRTDADGTTTYTYDTLNRLVAVTNETKGIRWSCQYDVFGNRVSVTDNGVTTEKVYLQGSLPSVAAEYDAAGNLSTRHIIVGAVRLASGGAGGSPANTRYYHADLLGSTRLLTDGSGATKGKRSFKAFGETRTSTGETTDAGYVGTLGVETDSNGLLFMRNRYYDAGMGRFVQMDPIGMEGGDLNLYRYCSNSSTDSTDLNGTFIFYPLYDYLNRNRDSLCKTPKHENLDAMLNDISDDIKGDPNNFRELEGWGKAGLHRIGGPDQWKNRKFVNDNHCEEVFNGITGEPILTGINKGTNNYCSDEEWWCHIPLDMMPFFAIDVPKAIIESIWSSVVQSEDPNEIVGTGRMDDAKRYVEPGQRLTYTIYFENKTNATAAAQEVFVDLPMDPNLDWTTLKLGEIAFGDNIDMGLSGKRKGTSDYANPGTNTYVRTKVSSKNGVLSWYIRDWDPTTTDNFPTDAKGGFLPPNDPKTHCGEGRVSYSVCVKADAPRGARINASAQIVFDKNPMIETDPSWFNTVAEPATVAFNANGGTGMMAPIEVGMDGSVALPANAFTWAGHNFAGWARSPNGAVEYANNWAGKLSAAWGETVTLYAKWTENAKPTTVTIRFIANGGTGTMADFQAPVDKWFTLPANKFSRNGYIFFAWSCCADDGWGWYCYGNGENQEDYINARYAGKTLVYRAEWAKPTYKVKFNANGGKLPKGKKMATQKMTFGKMTKLRKNVFTRNGYVFAGWAVRKNGPVAYANAERVDSLRTDGGTQTLYAVWAKPTYKVAFYANGGKGTMSVQTMKYGKATKLSANKFKAPKGKKFAGWAKSKKGQVVYKNKQAVKNLVTNGKTVKLYAVWKKK